MAPRYLEVPKTSFSSLLRSPVPLEASAPEREGSRASLHCLLLAQVSLSKLVYHSAVLSCLSGASKLLSKVVTAHHWNREDGGIQIIFLAYFPQSKCCEESGKDGEKNAAFLIFFLFHLWIQLLDWEHMSAAFCLREHKENELHFLCNWGTF